LKAASDYQDAELWAGVNEALWIAQLGKQVRPGVKFDQCVRQALKKVPTDPRPSAELHLTAGGQRVVVTVAVSKKDAGPAFAAWVKALDEALGGNVAWAVVCPRSQLSAKANSQAYQRYQELVENRQVRPFPLDANEDSFAQLECLRKIMQDAATGMVLLNGKPQTPDGCRKLFVETKLLGNLKPFDFLFQGWPALEAALPETASVAPTDAGKPISVARGGPKPRGRSARRAQ
jgi:hypothetical protein